LQALALQAQAGGNDVGFRHRAFAHAGQARVLVRRLLLQRERGLLSGACRFEFLAGGGDGGDLGCARGDQHLVLLLGGGERETGVGIDQGG
jgi:hypothetical protein